MLKQERGKRCGGYSPVYIRIFGPMSYVFFVFFYRFRLIIDNVLIDVYML